MVALTDVLRTQGGFLRRMAAYWAETPEPITPYAAPVFPEMPSVDAIETLDVLMVGYADGDLAEPARWLRDLGAKVRWIAPRLTVLAELADGLRADGLDRAAGRLISGRTGSGDFSHVMVDLDAMGGIGEACDALRRLRDSRPDLPVIVVSQELQVNDFSTERLPICDASLRAPVVFSALEFALTEARDVNNPAWQHRLADLRTLI